MRSLPYSLVRLLSFLWFWLAVIFSVSSSISAYDSVYPVYLVLTALFLHSPISLYVNPFFPSVSFNVFFLSFVLLLNISLALCDFLSHPVLFCLWFLTIYVLFFFYFILSFVFQRFFESSGFSLHRCTSATPPPSLSLSIYISLSFLVHPPPQLLDDSTRPLFPWLHHAVSMGYFFNYF